MPDAPRPDPSAPLWDGEVVTTGDGSRTLLSPRFGEGFRSLRGAHREARHVFVDGSGIAARLGRGEATRVLEVGLGAATNMGLTVAAAWAGRAPLTYVAIEREPLPTAAWNALDLASWTPRPFAEAWLRAWVDPAASERPLRVRVRHVAVDVWVGDIAEFVGRAAPLTPATFDAVYLDPFSPAANPDAWRPEVLSALAASLALGGALVSYSVQGALRRALAAAGLDVRKVPGPSGGKREVLIASRPVAAVSAATTP